MFHAVLYFTTCLYFADSNETTKWPRKAISFTWNSIQYIVHTQIYIIWVSCHLKSAAARLFAKKFELRKTHQSSALLAHCVENLIVTGGFLSQMAGNVSVCLSVSMSWHEMCGNILRPRQISQPFADNIFECNFLTANHSILIQLSLKFVHKSLINNEPTMVQIMAWRCVGDKPLFEPMMA